MSQVTQPNDMTEKEAFENGFFYFIDALETLSKPAREQCEKMGNVNVAWELLDDLKSFRTQLNSLHSQRLNSYERKAIEALLSELDSMPSLDGGSTRESNLIAMESPEWEPLREKASILLQTLEAATLICQLYLNTRGPDNGTRGV